MKFKPGFAVGVGALRVLSILPYGVIARFGELLGSVLYRLPSSRKRIVLINLKLCFPLWDPARHQQVARAHFQQLIRSYAERSVQWFGSERRLSRLVKVSSAIDLADTTAPPTIFLGFHFVGMEAGSISYSIEHPCAHLYTPMSSVAFDALAKKQRGRFGGQLVARTTSARQVVNLLRRRTPVVLATDMDHGHLNSVFVSFFGVQACTLTSVSRLARLSGARVVPFITEVLPAYRGYELIVFEPLADFPSDDPVRDTQRLSTFLEEQIVRIPEQYYWVHRRFKNRPHGEAAIY